MKLFGTAYTLSKPEADSKEMLETIKHSSLVSYWLKETVKSAMQRDPVDALKDAEVLVRLLKKVCNE